MTLRIGIPYLCLLLAACSLDPPDDTSAELNGWPGGQSLASIVVPVRGGSVHYDDGQVIPLPETTVHVDLVRLQELAPALGLQDLPAGTIELIKLTLDGAPAYGITDQGATVSLVIPLGALLGLWITGPIHLNGYGSVVPLAVDLESSFFVVPVSGSTWLLTPVVSPCTVLDVERPELTITYETSNMPDPTLDHRAASLHVSRVKPVFREGCSATQAMVMVHGRSLAGPAYFDTDYQDRSFMEALAMAGIDTYAVSLQGFGKSTFANSPMNDPRNASLPFCAATACAPGGTGPVPGGCDCPGVGLSGANHQGTLLSPNPLGTTLPSAPLAHTSSVYLQRITDQAADVDRVVDKAHEQLGQNGRVSLLGYSAGGSTAGFYLTNPQRRAKIDRAVFMASTFTPIGSGPNEPPSPSWPLNVINREVQFSLTNASAACLGPMSEEMKDHIWSGIMEAEEGFGAGWGTPVGLVRFPSVSRWGWNADAAKTVNTSALMIVGTVDNVTGPGMSKAIYDVLGNDPDAPATSKKVYAEVTCGSHSALWDVCSQESCAGQSSPYATMARHVTDWMLVHQIYPDSGTAVMNQR